MSDPIRVRLLALDSWREAMADRAALLAVLDLCDTKESVCRSVGQSADEARLFTVNIRQAIARALGVEQ
jgi:hypothetical protein